MRTAGRIDRRDFLFGASFAGLAGTGVAASAYLAVGAGGTAEAGEADLQDLVRSVFPDPGRAALVGGVFLKANPHEAERSDLLVRTVGPDWASSTGPHSRGALRSALRARIRSDLTASRTTAVGGWILSITEARLCALACMAILPRSGVA